MCQDIGGLQRDEHQVYGFSMHIFSQEKDLGLYILGAINRKIIDGLTVIWIIIIAILLGIGLLTLATGEGTFRENATGWVILTLSIMISMAGAISLLCWCLRVWIKEQH
jgi:hypothetical protein